MCVIVGTVVFVACMGAILLFIMDKNHLPGRGWYVVVGSFLAIFIARGATEMFGLECGQASSTKDCYTEYDKAGAHVECEYRR